LAATVAVMVVVVVMTPMMTITTWVEEANFV